MRLLKSKKKNLAHGSSIELKNFYGLSGVLIFGILFYLAYLALFGEKPTIVRWLSYLIVWAAAPLLFCSAVLFYLKKKILSFTMLLVACLVTYPHVKFVSGGGKIQLGGNTNWYTVMTYSKMGRNQDLDSVARVILSEKPDILFVQEISPAELDLLMGKISSGYDKPLNSVIHSHNATVSPYKIIMDTEKNLYSPKLTISLPESSVSLWNVHLQKSIFNTALQYKMVDQLVAQISSMGGPIIVAGDFNATILNYPYVVTKKYLSNAFEEAGEGFGFTFPSPARRMGSITPFLRIDHIFLSEDLIVGDVYVSKESGGSDHYPLISRVSFRNSVR